MPAYRSAVGARVRASILAALLLLALPALAATEQEAARLAAEGRFDAAAAAYQTLVAASPQSVRLRLALADALSKDRHWEEALAEYERVLRLAPGNAEALSSIGTVRRWQGHVGESLQAFERLRTAAPKDSAPVLGLAGTYAQDRDYARARELYDEAATRWPAERAAQDERYDFMRQVHPRTYVYFEDDLSFQTRLAGVAAPFLSREEIGYEHQQELRFNSLTGQRTFTRTDNRVTYTHFFGFNNTLETSLKSSSFDYVVPIPTTPFTTAIDKFDEIRVRYAVPLVPEQVAAVRYTARPTKLIGGETFTSHKVEAEVQSQWTPHLQTTLGTGLLHDLKDTALATSDTTNQVLWRLGTQYTLSDRADIAVRYITNPDLDSSIYSTLIVQGGYSFNSTYSGIARLRFDDYKVSDDQTSYYVGVRITPSSHLWVEIGVKYVERGTSNGFFGLASVILRF
jgi:hypothetical protein